MNWKKILKNMTIVIDWSIELNSNSIVDHILNFWDKVGQIWSKITQFRSQNKEIVFLGQKISL